MSAIADFKKEILLPVKSVVVNDRQLIVDKFSNPIGVSCDSVYDRMIEYGFSGTHADAARREVGERIAAAINNDRFWEE